jgi:hypothetical protein
MRTNNNKCINLFTLWHASFLKKINNKELLLKKQIKYSGWNLNSKKVYVVV